jgi:hypothetical protein
MKAGTFLTLCATIVVAMFVPGLQASADSTKSSKAPAAAPVKIKATKPLPKKQDAGALLDTHDIERRTGKAAARSAQRLLLQNKYFAKAHADLVSRGLKPVFEEHAVQIVATPKQQASNGRTGAAQFQKAAWQDTTISDGTYEMSFYPYSNGNNAVWEGIVTLRGGGNDDVDYVTLDVSREDSLPTITEYNYSNNGGGGCGACGGGGGDDPVLMTKYSLPDSTSLFQKASYAPRLNFVAASAAQSGGRLQRWAWCSAGGCWGGIIPCRWAGPGWAHCAAANCVGQMIGCAIQNMI